MAKRRSRKRRRDESSSSVASLAGSQRPRPNQSPSTTEISRNVSGLPGHKTSRSLRQASLLEAQQQFGNKQVQLLLASQGEAAAAPGSQIQRALSKEEKLEDLTSSRFAGDNRLQSAFDNSPPMKKYEPNHEAVKKLQQALMDEGHPMPKSTTEDGSPDGIFGGETKQVIKDFQGNHSLDVDGSAGRETLGRLDKLFGGPAPPKTSPAEDPEIEVTEEDLGKHVVEKMNAANKNAPDSGIWYSHVRRAYHKRDPAKYTWDEAWRDGKADEAYFVRVGYYDWLLKPGVSASAALKSWFKGLTIAECASTLTAIEIDGIRASLGDQKFDDMFGSQDKPVPTGKRLRIKQSISKTPFADYMVDTEPAKKGERGTKNNRPAKLGDWYYFYNHPKYLLKHAAGAWQGENSLYAGRNKAGDQLWSGLGAGNKTEDMLLISMKKAYDGSRTEQDYESITKYYALRPIPDKSPANPTYESLYNSYLRRVDPLYRHDKGEFKMNLGDKQEILDHPEYTIDGTERKGGFVPSAGQKLDVDKLKATRGS
jgi:peptidoglycan hydrolase-like protein with peptidoglycan-binding domain